MQQEVSCVRVGSILEEKKTGYRARHIFGTFNDRVEDMYVIGRYKLETKPNCKLRLRTKITRYHSNHTADWEQSLWWVIYFHLVSY